MWQNIMHMTVGVAKAQKLVAVLEMSQSHDFKTTLKQN